MVICGILIGKIYFAKVTEGFISNIILKVRVIYGFLDFTLVYRRKNKKEEGKGDFLNQ